MISLDNRLRHEYHISKMEKNETAKKIEYDARIEYINTEIFTIFDFDFFHFQSTMNKSQVICFIVYYFKCTFCCKQTINITLIK